MSKISLALRNLVAASLLSLPFTSQAITVNVTSLGNIEFDGNDDTFTFRNPEGGGHDFKISVVTGPGSTGNIFTSMNLEGDIDGVFKIGAITTDGDVETAPVTLNPGSVPGAFTIWDAQNVMLTASVQWIQIRTEAATGQLNSAGGVLNLTNILYAGTNPELAALANQGSHTGSATVTFQFDPAQSLTSLTEMDGKLSTTYLGALTANVPDGGATVAMLGLSLISVSALGTRLKAPKR